MLKRKTIIILSSLTLAIIIIASLIFTLSSNQTIDSNTSLDDFKDKDLITNEQWINALTEATGYEWFDNLKTLDYATKDFIAQTSIQATGFIADTIIQFADAHLIEDVNSAGLSVQVNILDMKRGNNFVPHENMTIADSKKSINRIKEIVAVPEIDPNHEDEIIYHKNVIDLSHLNTNNVTINDSEGKSISFKKADISNLKVGDIYIVPPSDIFPNSAAFKVSSISENDDIVTVANTEADISEVLSRIDIQGVYYPDFDNVITYAGIEDIGDSRSLYAQIDDIDWKEGIVHFRDDYIDEGHIEFGIEISDGSASISGMVKLLPRITAVYDVEYDVNWFRKNEWSVNELYFLLELDSEISVDFTGKIEKAIPIANFPFPICAGVSINLVVELVPSLEGGLSIRLSNYDSVGYKLVNGSLCRIENGN
ncbi:MAG: hypothetical protein FWC09_03390, partial [Lachnospiraceae bacterium]|nr:hypothetical protein [Lachnospiraceae bacterium]